MFLWLQFANSDWHDHCGRVEDNDRLDEPAWFADFLRQNGLPAMPRPTSGGLRRLKSLRQNLRNIAIACAQHQKITPDDLSGLNACLSIESIQPRLNLDRRGWSLQLQTENSSGLSALLFAIASSAAEFFTRHDPSRLRLCANPDCCWIFYDQTRSRTRCWCAANCRNLIKVRAHRQRIAARRKK